MAITFAPRPRIAPALRDELSASRASLRTVRFDLRPVSTSSGSIIEPKPLALEGLAVVVQRQFDADSNPRGGQTIDRKTTPVKTKNSWRRFPSVALNNESMPAA